LTRELGTFSWRQTSDCEKQRSEAQAKANWQLTTADARGDESGYDAHEYDDSSCLVRLTTMMARLPGQKSDSW